MTREIAIKFNIKVGLDIAKRLFKFHGNRSYALARAACCLWYQQLSQRKTIVIICMLNDLHVNNDILVMRDVVKFESTCKDGVFIMCRMFNELISKIMYFVPVRSKHDSLVSKKNKTSIYSTKNERPQIEKHMRSERRVKMN